MTVRPPNPGSRYIVRELLGEGRWKEVYRVVVREGLDDRALARFKQQPDEEMFFKEIKPLLHGARENIARLYGAFTGDDGEIYLEEELLYRPLESLAPLVVVDKFFKIARDLCTGLASLHKIGLVHRDLKLDNCGIDHFGVAKIFDLGSVTSEGGPVKGSILSRAPELFSADAPCTKASDVWAMGAVLFALRTGGDYPFVSKGEARTRPPEGAARKRFDEEICRRATGPDAGESLAKRINEEFPNGSGELVRAMLQKEPEKRPTAAEAADRWRQLLIPWIPAQTSEQTDTTESEFQDICAYLTAYAQGATAMSSRQWNRINSASVELGKKLDDSRRSTLQKKIDQAAEVRRAAEEKQAAETSEALAT